MALPNAHQIQELLEMLFGRKVSVTEAEGRHTFLHHPAAVGVYIDDAGSIARCCACDVALTSVAGAALAMMPPDVAEAATSSGKLEPKLAEHLRDVLEIMASLYLDAGGTQVQLETMHASPPLPMSLKPVMKTPSARIDVRVDVDGYAGGNMILFAS